MHARTHARVEKADPPEDLRARERRVHKQADGRVGQRLAQERRHEQQVVVVHPHEVARARDRRNARGERRVRRRVRGPVRVRGRVLRRDVLPEEVVEERPERWGMGKGKWGSVGAVEYGRGEKGGRRDGAEGSIRAVQRATSGAGSKPVRDAGCIMLHA